MSGADLFEDGYPHGTVEGYNNGCRGGACPGEIEYGMSCKRANQLNNGDYRYKKLAAAGKTPREIAAILAGTIIEPAATPAPAPPTPAQPLAERSQDAAPQEDAGDEPAIETEAPTDEPQVPAEPAAEAEEMGHPSDETTSQEKQTPPIKHGTSSGYSRGCRDDCPGDPVTGLTCRQYAVDRSRENKRRQAARRRDAATAQQPAQITISAWTEGMTKQQALNKGNEIRTWCRDNGHDIPAHGRIPQAALAAYAAAFPLPQPDGEAVEVTISIDVPSSDDIAHRSELLDETRARIEAPAHLLAVAEADAEALAQETITRAASYLDSIQADRPEWAQVAIAEDIERLRNLAARLEQELAHAEEERDQALAAAASAQRAMITAILRWDETNQVNGYLQLQLANLSAERQIDALYIQAIRESRDILLAGKLREAAIRRRRNR